MTGLEAAIGVILLLVGRKAFWFFVAAVGFLAGVTYAPRLVPGRPALVVIAVALAAGAVGALVAIVLRVAAIFAAGFFLGGHAAVALTDSLGIEPRPATGLLFVVGGAIVAVLLLAVFGWALIVISSLLGAWLVIDALRLPSGTESLVFAGLTIVGIVVQGAVYGRERRVKAL